MKFLFVLIIALFSMPSFASSYSISPLKLVAKNKEKVMEFRLTNRADKDVPIQIQIKKWVEKNNQDEYIRTFDMIATPTTATLKPKQAQLFRVGVFIQNKTNHIAAYRLFVRELPGELKVSSDQQVANNKNLKDTDVKLNVLLDISIPIFIEPKGALKESFFWSYKKGNDGKYHIILNNKGNTVLRVTHFSVQDNDSNRLLEKNILKYILPYKQYYWKVELKSSPKKIDATINGQKTSSKIVKAI